MSLSRWRYWCRKAHRRSAHQGTCKQVVHPILAWSLASASAPAPLFSLRHRRRGVAMSTAKLKRAIGPIPGLADTALFCTEAIIDGRRIEAATSISVTDPATGEVLGSIP